jgi:hypothetical protein
LDDGDVGLSTVADVPALLRGRVPAEGDRPLLTYCDDATGERVDLSASALAGWASRTVGLLHEGCGLGEGDRVAVLLPPHWQTAVAAEVAASLDLYPGDRLLVDAGEHEHPDKWLLAPLTAGASVVLCANLDPATVETRAAAEDATRVIGPR